MTTDFLSEIVENRGSAKKKKPDVTPELCIQEKYT